MPSISVIIPVKNGAATLADCIASIRRQTIAADIEIIVLDSGSADESVAIAEKFDAVVVPIPPGSFNHGETRNLGASKAAADFLYFTVQDAVLASDDVLEKMLAYFHEPAVMGVCGNQAVPHHPDKNPVDWYLPRSPAGMVSLHFETPEQFESLSPRRKTEVCGWDDVMAMYRKSALQQLPFVRCDYGEDIAWCKQALLKGFLLIRDTSLITWHYHFSRYDYRYKVRLVTASQQFIEFGHVPSYPAVWGSVRYFAAKLMKHPEVTIRSKLYWFFHNLVILLADLRAIAKLRKIVRRDGMDKVRELNLQYTKEPLMGRLKGQAL